MISLTIMSLVTSVKDYVEITHKLIEFEPLKNYTELGALFTYLIVSLGNVIKEIFSFSIFKNAWSIPIIIPDIASAMISEVSVLDGYFHSAFTFLETNINSANPGYNAGTPFGLTDSGSSNTGMLILEKFFIGLINSFFLFLPTSTSHLITLRRFVMQGLEAGYISGLGTLAGNFLWLASIILGWRFFVIPWLSFDIFRYVLGFILIVKYIWDSSKERRMVLEDLSKWKIFLLNFLLALTEQTCIYPFISNLSFGPEASVLEGFPAETYASFLTIHGAYLFGILIGSFSLLQFACWFWENPAFSIYVWLTTKSSNKISTSSYYKILNLTFLYCTMLCAIASVPYYGLDYTITNPIGLVPQDRILEQKKSQSDTDKLIPETSFLGVNPTDKNARIRDGVHARRERWKQRLIKYQAYDAAVYDQGVYDFLTIEDLNYGFDRFWLRRKMRNHQMRFRLFPGPWMRSLKKQLNKPANLNTKDDNQTPFSPSSSTGSAVGPRIEFFRVLFEQYYHPNFHDRVHLPLKGQTSAIALNQRGSIKPVLGTSTIPHEVLISTYKGVNSLFPPKGRIAFMGGNSPILTLKTLYPSSSEGKELKKGLIYEHSALRKFVRNFNTRTNIKFALQGLTPQKGVTQVLNPSRVGQGLVPLLPLKGQKQELSVGKGKKGAQTEQGYVASPPTGDYPSVYSKRWKSLFSKMQPFTKTSNYSPYFLFRNVSKQISNPQNQQSLKLNFINQKLYGKDFQILANLNKNNQISLQGNNLMLLRPLSFYLQKEQAFKRKLRYYGATTVRKLTIGNQAPYLKTLMKRGFYYYKPSLRFKKTLYVAAMRRGFRKKSRKQKNIVISTNFTNTNPLSSSEGSYNNAGNAAVTGANYVPLPSSPLKGPHDSSNPPYGGVRNKGRLYPLEEGSPKRARQETSTGVFISKGDRTSPFEGVSAELSSNRASYSVLNKRASRYRHQIYKDVLQHWYYTPFNRLALKFDIDAFINRQPKAHYLSKKEERMLHVKRFLLSEHYDTLRWYTYMQHYRTMKTNIGGTKSFANRVYNQQFQGTFKKIRHLFAITPTQSSFATSVLNSSIQGTSKGGLPNLLPPVGGLARNPGKPTLLPNQLEGLTDFSILKFDQPLYNDNNVIDTPIAVPPLGGKGQTLLDKKSIYLHEELLGVYLPVLPQGSNPVIEDKLGFFASEPSLNTPNNQTKAAALSLDLINQSKDLIGNQLLLGQPLKGQNNTNTSMDTKPELRLRALRSLLPQGGLAEEDTTLLVPGFIPRRGIKADPPAGGNRLERTKFIYSELLVKLIKECKRHIYDQSFLKNYISHRIQKREQRNQEQTRELNKRLEKLKNWLNFQNTQNKKTNTFKNSNKGLPLSVGNRDKSQSGDLITTGMQKALNDSIFISEEINPLYSNKPLLKSQSSQYKNKAATVSSAINNSYIKTEERIKAKILVLKTALSKETKTIGRNKLVSQVGYTLSNCKNVLTTQIQLIKMRTNKNLEWWRKKQRVITKRKTARKRDRFKKEIAGVDANIKKLEEKAKTEKTNLYKTLYGNSNANKNEISDYLLNSKGSLPLPLSYQGTPSGPQSFNNIKIADSRLLRKKRDSNSNSALFALAPFGVDNYANYGAASMGGVWHRFFIKKYRKKQSSKGRRYKSLSYNRYLTATRKPKLIGTALPPSGVNESELGLNTWYIAKIDSISGASGFSLNKNQKQAFLNLETLGTENVLSVKNLKKSLKKSQINKRSRHTWRKIKRHKFNTAQTKYRKRRIQSRGKLRVMSKKLKKITATHELRQWWWNSFLPRYLSNIAFNKTKTLGSSAAAYPSSSLNNSLKELDFKPLSKVDLTKRSVINDWMVFPQEAAFSQEIGQSAVSSKPLNGGLDQQTNALNSFKNFDISTTNLPFYAGWDESLRKFVITNRLLSRRDAGIEIKNGIPPELLEKPKQFTNSPIQGLNEASFLYLQTDMPFNSYNIDQFIPSNQSFYAPLGWRRFEFRHSVLKTWYDKINNGAHSPFGNPSEGGNNSKNTRAADVANSADSAYTPLRGVRVITSNLILSGKNVKKVVTHPISGVSPSLLQKTIKQKLKFKRAVARRIKKRYKLLKQTPNQLMYTPTGPLLTEVLPSHYISVFDQQYRFPRNRYLKRNLLKTTKKTTLLAMLDSTNSYGINNHKEPGSKEFTLRKRVKPRRKYHRKRFIKKDGLIFPRRTKFTQANLSGLPFKGGLLTVDSIPYGEESKRWRPSSRIKQKSNVIDRSKTKTNKRVKTNPLRLRQLRRREFQQIIKPSQRYQPRNGGFTWPGDYLRLEAVEMPKLKTNIEASVGMNTESAPLSLTEKVLTEDTNVLPKKANQKINAQPVGIMPRKYLIEKHNILVLKKKLEKAHASHKLTQALNEYKLLTQKNI
jgi:hypothetical protein